MYAIDTATLRESSQELRDQQSCNICCESSKWAQLVGYLALADRSSRSASARPGRLLGGTSRWHWNRRRPGSFRPIDEVHLAGFDINDCVLATAYDALDQGYFTFAIEECCGRTDSDRSVIDAALMVLRKQAMTNNSNRLHSIELII